MAYCKVMKALRHFKCMHNLNLDLLRYFHFCNNAHRTHTGVLENFSVEISAPKHLCVCILFSFCFFFCEILRNRQIFPKLYMNNKSKECKNDRTELKWNTLIIQYSGLSVRLSELFDRIKFYFRGNHFC